MTELIWEGKDIDDKRQGPVRVALPFQIIETVNDRATDDIAFKAPHRLWTADVL